MPYNTRRKSLSLPSLGIHVPMTHAARAAAAAAAAASKGASRTSPSASAALSPPRSGSESADAHPSKRQKRSHSDDSRIEQTPPPSPPADSSMTDVDHPSKIDIEGINDDIVEAVIVQLQSTANRPHLVKELATVLAQRLTSVQHSLLPSRQSVVTPSVSLTDDSGSDDADARRRELSPSPEVDLSPHQFEDVDDDFSMPATPIGSFHSHQRHMPPRRVSRHNSPPLEKDEREFTQTADVLQKRKLNEEAPISESIERGSSFEYGHRDDIWFGDHRMFGPTAFITSPSIKPSGFSTGISSVMSSARKEDEAESWLKLSKLLEWDKGAESIEIDELDGLLDAC
ncbi:hypothetical protein AUP68_06029 [Ilyonectria robusta]